MGKISAQKKNKKIAIVSDAIYPYNKGGKEKRIFELSQLLVKRGYTVTIYCMKWWEGKNSKIENGVILHAISPLYPLYSGKRRSIKEAFLFSLHCLILLKENFDVIDVDHMPHLVLFTTKLVCMLKHKKMIVTWNEVWGKEYWQKYLGKLGIIAYIIELLSVKTPDHIISVSKYTTDRLKEILEVKLPITTIPNGINYSSIRNVGASSEKSDVIFAGRLLEHKHVDVLLRSIGILIKNYPNIRCIIIGEGPEKGQLEKLTNELHLTKHVIFKRVVEQDNDLYALYKSSRVFVLPSTREGFGRVVLEANAAGIPVITINHLENAARLLIEGKKNGLLCELTPESMSSAIEDVLFSHALYNHTEKYALPYDWDHLVDKIEGVYNL